MTKNENLRLCGGTFFTLLLEARKQLLGANERLNFQMMTKSIRKHPSMVSQRIDLQRNLIQITIRFFW